MPMLNPVRAMAGCWVMFSEEIDFKLLRELMINDDSREILNLEGYFTPK